MLPIYLIAALSQNGIIGAKGAMPWYLPTDLKYFKDKTIGQIVIMGRKTWDSLNHQPLKGRDNIILTRHKELYEKDLPKDSYLAQDLAQAYELAYQLAVKAGPMAQDDGAFREGQKLRDVFIMGGAEIYRQTIGDAQKLFITEVLKDIEGDCRFPPLPKQEFIKESAHFVKAGPKDSADMRFCVFKRIKPSEAPPA